MNCLESVYSPFGFPQSILQEFALLINIGNNHFKTSRESVSFGFWLILTATESIFNLGRDSACRLGTHLILMWATAVYVSCALTRGADVMPLVAAVALIGFIFSAFQNKCPANAAKTLVPTICPLRNMEEEATVMSQLKSSGHMKTN